MRIVLLINPTAGGGPTRSRLAALEAAATAAGLESIAPAGPEEVQAAVRESVRAGYARILVAGGDGTLNRAIAEMAGTGIPLGIIPTGTVNVLAREFGIPLDPVRALQVARTGAVRTVDLGTANDRPFVLMAGLGFDAKVVSEFVPRVKEMLGSLAYITTGLQELTRYRPHTFHLRMDEREFTLQAWLLVVGNASYYAYELPLTRDARMDDGLLDVCVFAERNALDRLTQIGAVMLGQHMRHPGVSYFRTSSLTITAEPPAYLQLDGDPAGVTPVDIRVRPRALHVVVPDA